MDYEQMNNNKVELVGRVAEKPIYSHEVFGEGFYETKLEVARLSEQTDILPLTISERLLAQYDIKQDDTISVLGQFRSYNKIEGEKSRLMLTVFVRDFLPIEQIQNPNNIELTGFICKPPIYRVTPFKREISDVLVAINRSYNKSDYIPCIMWGRNARFVNTLSVGEKISVTGRIQSRIYQKALADGTFEERVAYEVSVNKISKERRLDISDQMSIADYYS